MKISIWLLAGLVPVFPLHAEPAVRDAEKALTQAVSNARQIGLSLFEFETEYGFYPNEETRVDVVEIYKVKLPGDEKSSNAAFRQIFAAGITGAEKLFYADVAGVKEGDDELGEGKTLAAGENAFSYISGLNAAGNPGRPLAICPLIPGTTRFDPKPFGGRAVVLRVDNSVAALPIDAEGRVVVDGVDLLSKDHPVWNGKEPDIRYPELLPVE